MLLRGHNFPKEIKVAYVNSSWFTVLESPTGELVPGSLEGQLLTLLSQAIGFKYELIPATDGQWGSKTADGNWSGVVGLVNRTEADIAVNYVSITSDRMDAVDFSEHYTETGLTFATNLPELLPKKYLYLYPFSLPTWTCILVTLFVLAFVMSQLQDAKWLVFDRFWMIYKNMLRQPVCEKELNYRFFVGFSWLVISVISMSYAAVILSFLTVPLFEKPLTNFQDLHKAVLSGEYAVLSKQHGNSAVELLNRSKIDYLQSISRMIQNNDWYEDRSTLNQKFNREEFEQRKRAMLGSRFGFETGLGRTRMSPMNIAKDDATMNRIAVAVNKNFCCIDVLNSAIRRIKQSGIYGNFQSKIKYEALINSYQNVKPVEHCLTMEDISGANFVLLIGYAVSLTVFLCEVRINSGKKKEYVKQFKFI